MNYENLIYERCATFINTFDTTLAPDVYALGLGHETYWISEPYSTDPFEVNPQLLYQDALFMFVNTLTNWRQSIEEASDDIAAKWNPSFWLVNKIQQVAPCTLEELEVRDQWCSTQIVPIRRLDEHSRPVYNESNLMRASIEACTRVIHQLHQDGLITAKFGNPVPILIFVDEGILAAEAPTRANPFSESLEAARQIHQEWHGSWY